MNICYFDILTKLFWQLLNKYNLCYRYVAITPRQYNGIILWVFLNDFSKEQRGSLRMILGPEHVGAILSVLILNFM